MEYLACLRRCASPSSSFIVELILINSNHSVQSHRRSDNVDFVWPDTPSVCVCVMVFGVLPSNFNQDLIEASRRSRGEIETSQFTAAGMRLFSIFTGVHDRPSVTDIREPRLHLILVQRVFPSEKQFANPIYREPSATLYFMSNKRQ